MALFGFTGPADPELLLRAGNLLSHRGAARTAAGVGGDSLEEDGDVRIAWSGQLRGMTCSLADQYRQHGIDFLRQLEGEFALVLQQGETLWLARDPVGARTCYYGQHRGRWHVAAEPKGIWQLPGFSRRIRPTAVSQYFTYSFIPGSGTMLEGIHEVLPGQWVQLQSNQPPVCRRYFSIDLSAALQVPAESAPQQFRRLLEEEVAQRLPTNESPVVFLSGGLDSSIVTAEVARQSAQRVRTFAIHFGRDYGNELEFARMAARRAGTDHEEVEITPRRAVCRMRQMVWHLDEPIGDPVTAPNFELAAYVADQGISQVFNGEGGDPLFGGPKNLTMLLGHWYGGTGYGVGHRTRAYLRSYRRAWEELPHLLTEDFYHPQTEQELARPLLPYLQADGPFLHKLLAINTQLKGAHLILPKIERMLAASGITPLSPLFSTRMLELAFRTAPAAKLQNGVEKWLMKGAYRNSLPSAIINRPKSGMRVPVHFWFQGPLKKYAASLLSRKALKSSGIFHPERVQQWLRYDIEQPNGRYGLRLWMLLTFELWRRIVVEGEAV